MFDSSLGSLSEKSLNLEIKTGEENYIEDEMLRLKISQYRKKRGEKNWGVERVGTSLARVDSWYLIIVKKKTLAYKCKDENPMRLLVEG